MFEVESTRIGLIGAGRLAGSLAAGLCGASYRVVAVASARSESAHRLAAATGAESMSPQALVEACDLIFLTVPDAAIAELACTLPWRPEQAVVHCSGALGLEVLEPASRAGALPGCLHPLQSFPAREGDATRFHGITCGIEAAGDLGRALERMAVALGARVVRLEGVDRAAYHAAAVFVSNYVVALMAASERVWTQAGLPREAARAALAPLLAGAAQNIAAHPLAEALTGPVARGDLATVERHLAALGDSALGALYRALGIELLALDLGHAPELSLRLRATLAGEGLEV